ncbi:MAG: hypothetical protein PHC49_01755 [Desulfuromonadaceae bacterium]|nr:hypothetical protein [Desulfuromonadaceae bacterium]
MFPVPDGGLGDSDDLRDFSLEETEVHSSLADVVTDCDGEFGITGKLLFF